MFKLFKISFILSIFSIIVSCNSGTEVVESTTSSGGMSTGKSIVMGAKMKSSGIQSMKKTPNSGPIHHVKVIEAQSGDRYSYLRVHDGNRKYWITSWKVDAHPGDDLYFQSGILKVNMFSKALNKQLDTMYMVSRIAKSPEELSQMVQPDQKDTPGNSSASSPLPKDIKIVKIADLNAHPDQYEGKFVTVMGKSVKVNNHILGKNWIHIQSPNGDDIAITTQDEIEVGQPCTFTGKVYKDMDFGSGYRFNVIIQEAKLLR